MKFDVHQQYTCFTVFLKVTLENLLFDKPVSFVQIVITSNVLSTAKRGLVSSTYFDWRPYFMGNSKCKEVNLNHWTNNVSIELQSTYPDCNVSR